MPKLHSRAVFVSFRSGDVAHAERLHDHLSNGLGREEIFLDREPGNIRVTDDFLKVIKAAVEGAEILIALIGPAWASNENLIRLNDPEDVVRLELGRAFERASAGEKVTIIPVLVGGAQMPRATDSSPAQLLDLVKIQALTIPDESTAYREGLSRLLDAIDRHSPGLRARRQNTWLREALSSPDESRARFGQDIAIRAPNRQFVQRDAISAALDAWWRNWPDQHNAFLLLGEEGDGKSWAVADWLAHLMDERDFVTPIVHAPALRLPDASIDSILTFCLEMSQPTLADDGWRTRIRTLTESSSGAAPLFLLVIDALNERPSLNWRDLFDTLRVQPWRSRIAVVVLCRRGYWDELELQTDSLTCSWDLGKFNDHELDEALETRGRRRDEFDNEILSWMAHPRYFDLALRLEHQVLEGGLTLERLLYEDWRDRTLRRKPACSHDEFLAMIQELAERYEARSFQIKGLVEAAEGLAGDVKALRTELTSSGVVGRDGRQLRIGANHLPLALGLVLADEVRDAEGAAQMAEVIAARLGSHSASDLSVRICAMAMFLALYDESYPEAGRLALLRAWIEGRNLNDADLQRLVHYLPLQPQTFLRLAEHVWGTAENREVQDAFMVGLLRHRGQADVAAAVQSVFTRWLGFVHPWGYLASSRDKDEERDKCRRLVEERLGCSATPGGYQALSLQLEVIEWPGLLRLAEVAFAVISHDHARGYVNALATGIVASTVMGGTRASLDWVLRTANASTTDALLALTDEWMNLKSPLGYQAAHFFLQRLASITAYERIEQIPREYKPQPQGFGWLKRWDEDNYLQELDTQPELDADLVARNLNDVALNPDMSLPFAHRDRLNGVGPNLDLRKAHSSEYTQSEDLTLKEITPALCAFAPLRYRDLMRELVRTLEDRDALARRQLSRRILQVFPVLGAEEQALVLRVWRAVIPKRNEEDFATESFIFPSVLLGLSAAEQSERVIERGETEGYFTDHAPQFRPICAQNAIALLTNPVAEWLKSPEGPTNILIYLSDTLTSSSPEIGIWLRAHFEELPIVARGACMELICRTSDAETAREIIASGWRREDDRKHYFENLWGSILLARFGESLSFSELIDRISPVWLGYAIEQRGNRPEDVEAYADFLDATWKKFVVRPQSPDLERLTRHIRLKVCSGKELQLDYWSATDNPNGEKQGYIGAWGGRYRNPPVKDISEAFDLKKQRDAHRALQSELDELIVREGESGNPWLTTSFYHGSLAEVVSLDSRRWECWVAPVRSGNAQGRYLLSACRGFYEKLCATLLAASPQDGFVLYEALEAHPSAHIVDHWFDLPVLLMDVFAAPESGETRQIRERLLDAATTDMDLFEIVLLSAWGAKMDWLHRRINEDLESSWEFERARALTLLGASDHDTDGLRLAEWIKQHPDCWLRRVAELAHLRFTRNRWAHIWFERFLTRTDRTESWAAFQLFLRCVDRRLWLWQERVLLKTAEQWKQDAFGFNVGDVLSASRENEKHLHKSLVGHAVKWGEYWPWMREYEQLD
jgi:hypothetical protein